MANKLYVKAVLSQAVSIVAMDLRYESLLHCAVFQNLYYFSSTVDLNHGITIVDRELWKFYSVHLNTLLAYDRSAALSTCREGTDTAPSSWALEDDTADLLNFYKSTQTEVLFQLQS